MSQQGPIIVVSTAERRSLAAALGDARIFPVIDVSWTNAPQAVEQLQPAAVLVAMSKTGEPGFEPLAKQVAARQPYLPLIAIDPRMARLHAALRVRTLHATVMRRLDDDPAKPKPRANADPVRDATVLLIGRDAAYPALSVLLGERMGLVGALSIEAAARHLNARDIDGIILGEGFSRRVMDAFLTVLAEDARFRNLPVVVTANGLTPAYDLPNLEFITGAPDYIAANALP